MENTLAVLSCTGQSISFFDIANGERKAYIDGLIEEPHELLLDKKRAILYCSHTYRDGMYAMFSSRSHEVSIIDPATMKVIDVIDVAPANAPHDLAIDEKNDILWISVESLDGTNKDGAGMVGVDLKTKHVVKRVRNNSDIHWFVMTSDGEKAYTCNKTAPTITVLDLKSERAIGNIDVSGGTEQPALSRCGRYMFFPTPSLRFGTLPTNPAILVVDTATDSIVKTVSLEKGFGPASTHVTSTGEVMVAQYCFDETKRTPINGRVSVFDAKLQNVQGQVDVGLMPLTMRSSNDGKVGYVANAKGGTVDVIDLQAVKKVKTINVDVVEREQNKFQTTAHGMALIHIN